MKIRAFLTAASMLVLAVLPAHAEEEAPEGWDAYRFGMTLEEATAVPGLAFEEWRNDEDIQQKVLRSASEVEVGGTPFRVTLHFRLGGGYDEGWLSLIRLMWKRSQVSEVRCAQKHGQIVERMDARYGVLTRSDRDGPYGNGSSSYSAYKHWWVKQRGDFTVVKVRTHWNEHAGSHDPNVCDITISYDGGKPPAKEPAPGIRQF
jgi:hypothetical protein